MAMIALMGPEDRSWREDQRLLWASSPSAWGTGVPKGALGRAGSWAATSAVAQVTGADTLPPDGGVGPRRGLGPHSGRPPREHRRPFHPQTERWNFENLFRGSQTPITNKIVGKSLRRHISDVTSNA